MYRPRVIVTRPLAQALPWVAELGTAGVDAVALPLMAIEPLCDAALLRRAWQQIQDDALVMFVSANAVQHFMAARPDGLSWPPDTRAGSTGPGTSAALRGGLVPEACIVEPAPGMPFETESLWAVLRSLDWRGRQVLVVRGEDGRDWLADTLREAGAGVRFLAAYRRAAPVLDPAARQLLADALARPQSHLWHFSSSEAVGHLKTLAPQADWSAAQAIASHPRIAQAAQRAGFGGVRLVGPSCEAVAEAALGDPGRYNRPRRD